MQIGLAFDVEEKSYGDASFPSNDEREKNTNYGLTRLIAIRLASIMKMTLMVIH